MMNPENEKKTTNGDAIRNEKIEAKVEKKGFWAQLPDDAKVFLTIVGGVGAFVIGCIAAGAAAEAVASANNRATMNSKGFKDMLDRGVLDPVPPPKTLEEAAARIITDSPRILPVYDPSMVA